MQSWGAHPMTLAASVQVPGVSRRGQNLGVLVGRPVPQNRTVRGARASGSRCPTQPGLAPDTRLLYRKPMDLLSPVPTAGLSSPREVATHRRTSWAQGFRGASACATTRPLLLAQLGDESCTCGARSA